MARVRLSALCLAVVAAYALCLPSAQAQPPEDDGAQGDGGQGFGGQGFGGQGFGFPGQGFGIPGQNGPQRGGRRGQNGPGQGMFPGGFGQGMFPGGFGMFGGGTGRGGRTSGMMGSPNDPFILLKNEAVRDELKLTKKQTTQVDKLIETYENDGREQMQQARIDPDELQSMSDDERTKAFEKSRDHQEKTARKLNDKYRPRLSKLLKPDQEKRLKQISWQVIGVMALRGDDLAKALKLSKDQRADIEEVVDDSGKKMRDSFRPPEGGFRGRGQADDQGPPPANGDDGGNRRPAAGQRGGDDGQDGGGGRFGRDFRERFENMRKMNEDRDAKVLAVLTEKQRQQYEQLKGDPFDVSQLRPRWGRGRGGQRGADDQAGGADRGSDRTADRGTGRADRGTGRDDRGDDRAQARGTGRRRAQDDSE